MTQKDELSLPHANVHADAEGVTIEPGGDRQAAHLTLEELDQVREKAREAAEMVAPLTFADVMSIVQEIGALPWFDAQRQPLVWLASLGRYEGGGYRATVYDSRTDTLHRAETRGQWHAVRARVWQQP